MRVPPVRRPARAVLPAACSLASVLLVVGAATPAFATGDDPYTVQLRQQLPRTATSAEGGVPQEPRKGCPGIPDGQDGWHFVLPGRASHFVKLTVTFEPGGQQLVTDFGPPSDKHAYVASLPGAELTSAVAEVRGGELELFNLSHTCPAVGGTTPSAPGAATPASPESSGSSIPSHAPEAAASGTPGSAEEISTPSDSAPAAPAGGAAVASAPAGGGAGEGDLAETGNGAPVGLLLGIAATLLAAGGHLVVRRRRATRG
ncbi:LPXTG cell wall anchor domain-containing protein [Streptomyces sp. TRM68367]|uniref:LPXTG cell wall anchor domain-containing protein n=1 Tax=Streptomyces sp. TRM68367 TaxID=2758415 RepID=UPI00165AD423|nr:LPXTG cell wall anchor domain-containing protein [Streptomyces sp. TRM68367]MBC9727324.1 LPXTG cell wall anchor domain-containing protein [Streptomyces sp. TRM68367]